jgi:chromosome segregation ATPase
MSCDTTDCALREKVAALEADKRTLEAHVEMLRMHNAALDARAEHVADLRAHAGVQQQHGDALKAQHDSAMHELRLQHERTVTALTRQIELLQQLLQSKEQHTASLCSHLEEKDNLVQSKDRHMASLERQLEEKDMQLPELVKAAAAESLRSEVASLRSALDEQKSAAAAAATRVAALEATIAEKDAELAAKKLAQAAADAPAGCIVATANVVVGRRVRRGPHWKYGDQDGGAGRLGTIVSYKQDWCTVRWDRVGGGTFDYRTGAQASFDLVYAG